MLNDKVLERKLLLKRVFLRNKLFRIGKTLNIPYFHNFHSEWNIDDNRAALEIASNISDELLKEVFSNYEPRKWEVFRGQYYTFENGEFKFEGSWKAIQAAVAQTTRKYGGNCVTVLKCLVESGKGCSLKKISQNLPEGTNPSPILSDLEKMKVIVTSYKSKEFQEWMILEETSPIIQSELGLAPKEVEKRRATITHARDVPTKEARPPELNRARPAILEGRHRRAGTYGNRCATASRSSFSSVSVAAILPRLKSLTS